MKQRVAEVKQAQLVRHNLCIDNAQWIRGMKALIWETKLELAEKEDGDYVPYSD